MDILAAYKGETLRVELDTEPNTDLLHYVTENFGEWVQFHVSQNPHVETRTLLLLAECTNEATLRNVARHKNSTVEVWEKLFDYNLGVSVAGILATKPLSSITLHKLLITNHHTANSMINNPNTSTETLAYIIELVTIADLSGIFTHPNCSKEIVTEIISSGNYYNPQEQNKAWDVIKSWPEHADWPEEWLAEHYGKTSTVEV